MRIVVEVEVPDIVGDLLLRACAESKQVLICPDSIAPGYIGNLVRSESSG